MIFYALGFLVAAGLLRAVWRRYFPEVSVWVATVGILTLGLATGTLEVLSQCDVYEVAMSCGFAFTMLALAAIWCALHEPKRQVLWLLLASLAYGLAIGSRPSLLFGVIILLMPVAQAWRAATEPGSRRRVGLLLVAAVGPVMLIGLGLMLYNTLRFDNPFEFGWHYQLQQATGRMPPSNSVCITSGSTFGSIFWNQCDGVVISPFCKLSRCRLCHRVTMGWENLTVGY